MEIAKISHSQSQPGGIDRTPPGTPKKGGKMLAVRVLMLDDTITLFQVQAKALGRVLFDQVCSQLHLLESDYFGLEYQELGGTKYWLDLEKPLSRQIGLSLVDTLVKFCVKFYTPDPSQLEEEFTRYLFCLQIKRDLSQGLLQCNSNTAALMASYIVQAECGDYVVEDYPDYRYLSSYKFVPNQDQELEKRIMENHKKHAGQSPAEADLNLLETARRCELYGIKMHSAKDHEGVPLNLAVAHMGIVVFQNFTKINTFSWAKIRKISFKRKRFLVKLHPEGYGYYKDTVEFFFEGRNECKNFWKKCVENHGFFRCSVVKKVPRHKTRVLSRGSSFRYSGRTQKQIVDFVRENYVKRQTFQRSQSFRHSSSAHSSVANVGTSISAHPLLPLGENAVVGTPASLSCGSMTLTSSPLHAADIHVEGMSSPPLTTSISPGTSITSSPQHFYLPENLYRRADHRSAKMKHSQDQFLHGISPLQSPTSAASAASSNLVNLFNINESNINIDKVTVDNSDSNLKGSGYASFNDVYSNCYSSLRSLQNDKNVNANCHKMKTDVCEINVQSLNRASKSNECIISAVKVKSPVDKKLVSEIDYDWHRSSSYKDLPNEKNIINQNENGKIKSPTYNGMGDFSKLNLDTFLSHYNNGKRKCYSEVTSKNSSVDNAGDIISEMKIYSNSYPGTISSLSTVSAEGELQDPLGGLETKYDSQEEIVLSHEDVSHDSYELLEKELDVFGDELLFHKKEKGVIRESDRARSCSWDSCKILSPLDSRSTDNVVNSRYMRFRENGFWSLERERSLKHKSENDFRSLDRKSSKEVKNSSEDVILTSSVIVPKRVRQKDYTYNDINIEEKKKKNKINDGVDYDTNKFGTNHVKVQAYKSDNFDYIKYVKLGDREARKRDKEIDGERVNYQVSSFPKKIEVKEKWSDEKEIIGEGKKGVDLKRDRNKDETFHEFFRAKESKSWEKEKCLPENKSNIEDEKKRIEKDVGKKSEVYSGDYSNFKEIHFKKFDRVVSNQFGKYSEFLNRENDYDWFVQEKKVIEGFEKVRKYEKAAKDVEKKEKTNILDLEDDDSVCEKTKMDEEELIKLLKFNHESQNNEVHESPQDLSNYSETKLGLSNSKSIVERTKSDSYNCKKHPKRNVLTHQKSIDFTSTQSIEGSSKYIKQNSNFKKSSRSEQDIPYTLHKRHYLNNGSKSTEFSLFTSDGDSSICSENSDDIKNQFLEATSSPQEDILFRQSHFNETKRQIADITDNFRTAKSKLEGNILTDTKKYAKVLHSKPCAVKKLTASDIKNNTKMSSAKEGSELEFDTNKDSLEKRKGVKSSKTSGKGISETPEPIYDEVVQEPMEYQEQLEKTNVLIEWSKHTPLVASQTIEKLRFDKDYEAKEEFFNQESRLKSSSVEPLKLSLSALKRNNSTVKNKKDHTLNLEVSSQVKEEVVEICTKIQPVPIRGRPSASSSVQRHKESLILFARTRLGLSEGSAFMHIRRQGHVSSPTFQRRTKSLDAPYISVHSLPPVDAFSSKDDTVDSSEVDMTMSGGRNKILGNDFKTVETVESTEILESRAMVNVIEDSESSLNTFFSEDMEMKASFETLADSQSKLEVLFSEEKIVKCVQNKRLLSKIESADGIESDGDMDSSKQNDISSIPVDRLVNLPESVRFPSVRQISGQTSEESADGWEQKNVKVKRRTPRRSVGKDDPDAGITKSTTWNSKDDAFGNDEVWDDNLVFNKKYDSSLTDTGIPVEYLKRGSCGQSIDDDNLSTPMKESSPEHWVSVDDLPEALEREEKQLRQKEKMLREKILNEKIKRELNLDTIDINEKYYNSGNNDHDSQTFDPELLDLKGKLKCQSLDTYELSEKKLGDQEKSKYWSFDEYLLRDKRNKTYFASSKNHESQRNQKFDELSDYDNVETLIFQKNLNCFPFRTGNELTDAEDFDYDNDDDLEEFFVVLDENGESEKESKNIFWKSTNALKNSLSKEGSVISVPEQFKDIEEEPPLPEPDFLESESICENDRNQVVLAEEKVLESKNTLYVDDKKRSKDSTLNNNSFSSFDCVAHSNNLQTKPTPNDLVCSSRLNEYEGSRKLSSEESKKGSVSESISEETRRRLSSTDETRRKRASLTKQCSVGADSLSDEMISEPHLGGSSLEHDDEKDVFEAEPVSHTVIISKSPTTFNNEAEDATYIQSQGKDTKINENVAETMVTVVKKRETSRGIDKGHLLPPATVRELSRETEDSLDYCENFKEIRDAIGEKDEEVSLLKYNSNKVFKNVQETKSTVSFDKKESSEDDELLFIDEKVISDNIDVLNKEENVTPVLIIDEDSTPESENVKKISTTHKESSKSTVMYENSYFPVLENNSDKIESVFHGKTNEKFKYSNNRKSSIDSSQDSDIDKLNEVSFISHVQNQISRRNLSEVGKNLRFEEFSFVKKARAGISERRGSRKNAAEEALAVGSRTSSEELEKTESSSLEGKSSADECRLTEKEKKISGNKGSFRSFSVVEKDEGSGACIRTGKKKNLEYEKRDSGEDGSSSSSTPLHPKRELSSTWKPFLLESSGSSSLEENWIPPDDNANLADEEETSSTSNNQQDESGHDEIEFSAGLGYSVLSKSSAEMIVGGYCSGYALSRTLSRISERSTSDQERSDLEDDFSKPSSHSASFEDESMLSSDRQPSLSSDPPSLRGSYIKIPDLPDDRTLLSGNPELSNDKKTAYEPFSGWIPPPLPDDYWLSPSASSGVEAQVQGDNHVETVYSEIYPEEASKVVVPEQQHNEGNSSSDENLTLHDEGEFLNFSSDNISASTTTTTQEGTVLMPLRRKSLRTGSISEDTSVVSTSDWSSSTGAKLPGKTNFGTSDWTKNSSLKASPGKINYQQVDAANGMPMKTPYSNETKGNQNETQSGKNASIKYEAESQTSKMPTKPKPTLRSPTGKIIGFFETPVSKILSPTSQARFFENKNVNLESCSKKTPKTSSSRLEIASPKNYKKSFDSHLGYTHHQASNASERCKKNTEKTESKAKLHGVCTPYYSNFSDSAEKSFFGCSDSGSLERSKISSSRKCRSYYSMTRAFPEEEGSSSGEACHFLTSHTIPRASKKIKKKTRTTMELEIHENAGSD